LDVCWEDWLPVSVALWHLVILVKIYFHIIIVCAICNRLANPGEISIPDIRGTVGYFFSTNIGLGILFTQILGLGLDWRFISGVCAITPLVLFALLYFVPESPYFLVKNSTYDDIISDVTRKFVS
jgi:hypothetical protein